MHINKNVILYSLTLKYNAMHINKNVILYSLTLIKLNVIVEGFILFYYAFNWIRILE